MSNILMTCKSKLNYLMIDKLYFFLIKMNNI